MTTPESRTIHVKALTRVEGEGALRVRIRDGRVTDVQFQIHEPPRFFEALLRGRMYTDAPDITSRICGICPVAYIMSAVSAMEAALGVVVDAPLADLRRLAYCGEWIESHVLHATFLHAPDFLGLADAFAIAKTEPGLVKDALALKRLGNRIIEVIGGRAIHPVNFRVGGFYALPPEAAVHALVPDLEEARARASRLAQAFARFDFPDVEGDDTFVSLSAPETYAIEAGRIVSSTGFSCSVDAFADHFAEDQVRHSTALYSLTAGGGAYLTGPLARYANNGGALSPAARALAIDIGLERDCRNPFRSILVRMVEVAYACEEAARLAAAYRMPERPSVPVAIRAGIGHGATEAPRGLLVHRYCLDDDGRILEADIVPPTAQNQKRIEADLLAVVEAGLDLADDDLQWRCEQAIRNHDPCISCATHFLSLDIDRA